MFFFDKRAGGDSLVGKDLGLSVDSTRTWTGFPELMLKTRYGGRHLLSQCWGDGERFSPGGSLAPFSSIGGEFNTNSAVSMFVSNNWR